MDPEMFLLLSAWTPPLTTLIPRFTPPFAPKSHQFIGHGAIIANEYEKFSKTSRRATNTHFTCHGT